MSRSIFVTVTVVVSLLLGVIGDILFTTTSKIGMNAPLFVIVLVASVLLIGGAAGIRLNRRNLWVLLPLIAFAIMLAVRDDETISFFNVLAVIGLGALGLTYIFAKDPVDEDAVTQHAGAAFEGFMGTMLSPFSIGVQAAGIGWSAARNHKTPAALVAVGRGVLITLPILFVFIILFAAADAVFAGMIDRFSSLLDQDIFDLLARHAILIGTVGWIGCGAIAFGVGRHLHQRGKSATAPQDEKPKPRPFTLGIIEASVILGSVVALFGAFVAIQFAYFFGGERALALTNLSHAEYARRGFFELVAVSIMTLGLVLWLDWVVVRHTSHQKRFFRLTSTALVALTGVILVSAANRMYLYEEAWGFTHLRVFVHVFIYWLGGLFGVFLLALYRVRGEKRIFSVGMLLIVIGYFVSLNAINLDHYIAERNIARYYAGQPLDTAYLHSLSADAVPALISFYRSLPAEDTTDPMSLRYSIGQSLARTLNTLRALEYAEQNRVASVLQQHISRDFALAALVEVEDQLPVYDPRFYPPSFDTSYSEFSRES